MLYSNKTYFLNLVAGQIWPQAITWQPFSREPDFQLCYDLHINLWRDTFNDTCSFNINRVRTDRRTQKFIQPYPLSACFRLPRECETLLVRVVLETTHLDVIQEMFAYREFCKGNI